MRALLAFLLLWPVAALAQDGSDRGFVQGLLEDALSAEGRTVRIEGFAGTLSSRATIDRITVSDPQGIWLEIDDVVLVWTRSALLNGRIEIDEISARRLSVARPPVATTSSAPAAEAPGRFALPDLPVSLRLGQLSVPTVDIGSAFLGEDVTLSITGAAELAGGAGSVGLAMQREGDRGGLTLSGAFDNTSRNLTLDLSLEEPQDGIAARLLGLPGTPSVAMSVKGDAPLSDFAANIRLATDGRERLAGAATLSSADTGEQTFDLDIGGDLAPVLAPDYRAFLGSRVDLVAHGTRQATGALSLDDLKLTTDALSLSGSAVLAPDGWPDRFDLRGTISSGEGGAVLLPLPGQQTRISGAQITARFDAATGNQWSLRALVDDLQQPGQSVTRLALTGDGEIDRPSSRVSGNLAFSGTGIAPATPELATAIGDALDGRLRFDWSPDSPLALQDMTLAGADYGLQGQLSLTGLADDFNLILRPDIRLRADDLSRFGGVAGMPLGGAARLDIKGTAEPLSGLIDLTFDGQTRDIATGIAQLDPLLRGTGRLSMAVTRDETGTRIAPLALETSAAQITGNGALAQGASRLDGTATLARLSDVVPGLTGPASVTLSARQDGAVWALSAQGDGPGGTQLGFDGTVTGDAVQSLALRGDATLRVARLEAFSALAGQPLGGALTLTANGSGDAIKRDFSAQVDATGTDLRSGLANLDTLLRGTTHLSLFAQGTDKELRLDTLSLDSSGMNGSAQGMLSQTGGALDYAIRLPDLGRLVPELPGAASLRGSARNDAGDRWQVDASGTGPGGVGLTVSGSARQDASRVDLAVTGTAPLALADAYIRPRALSGMLRFDLAVNGPPALSSVTGNIQTNGARLALPELRNAVTGISVRARLDASRAMLDATGTLASGGQVALRGPVSLTAPNVADLSASLGNVVLREPGLFETTANGTVTVTGPLAGGARIGGRIGLEQVEAQIPDIGPSYEILDGLRHVAPPADVQRTLLFAGLTGKDSGSSSGNSPAYPIDLVVDAPNRIFVRGRGLDAELGGALRLTGTTTDIVPQGQFSLIRGRLDLLGRRLTLTEGSISLRGSFDPIIRLAATTDVDGTAITIAVEGPAADPDLIIQSDPNLPEDEVLSLFLFGKSVTSISPLQAVQLAQAVRTLSGRGSGGLIDKIRTGLNIDDLDLGTDASGTAQARVGAYISENIYTDVTVTADGDSEINLNLDVSKDFTIRGRLGSHGDSGIGLFYEKDY